MPSLLRLLVILLLLGAAMHQGWLQAAIGFVIERLGGPAAMDPLPQVDAMGLLRRLREAVTGLPDPWFSLALMTGGIIGLILAASVINGLVQATLRLAGWLRDPVA